MTSDAEEEESNDNDGERPLRGLRVCDIAGYVADALGLIHACTRAEHYRCAATAPDGMRVVMTIDVREDAPPAVQGARTRAFPVRVVMDCVGEQEEDRIASVWGVRRSPLSEPSAPPRRVPLEDSGALSDFLFLHLCVALVPLRALAYQTESLRAALPALPPLLRVRPVFSDASGRVEFCVAYDAGLGAPSADDAAVSLSVASDLTLQLEAPPPAAAAEAPPPQAAVTTTRAAFGAKEGASSLLARTWRRIAPSAAPAAPSAAPQAQRATTTTGAHFYADDDELLLRPSPDAAEADDDDELGYIEHCFHLPKAPHPLPEWHPQTLAAIGAILDQLAVFRAPL